MLILIKNHSRNISRVQKESKPIFKIAEYRNEDRGIKIRKGIPETFLNVNLSFNIMLRILKYIED